MISTDWPNASILGVISDTHGLIREKVLAALQGCDLIIHAGDVGRQEVLDALRRIAPVVAIRGNIDKGTFASELPATAVVTASSVTIYVLHDLKELDLDPRAAGFDMVISGHSHEPSRVERGGILYLNPGAAGPRRFRLPITIARLDLRSSPAAVEFLTVG